MATLFDSLQSFSETGFKELYILFAKTWVSIEISRADNIVEKVSCFDRNVDLIASGSDFMTQLLDIRC